MMDYKNQTNKSCVYDAFKRAGLHVSESMMNGVSYGELKYLLDFYGYDVLEKGQTAVIEKGECFFVIRTPVGDFGGHAEYHINWDGISDYDPKSICAVDIKRK